MKRNTRDRKKHQFVYDFQSEELCGCEDCHKARRPTWLTLDDIVTETAETEGFKWNFEKSSGALPL